MEKMFEPAYTFIPPDTFIWHSKVMPYIIYWFIGWRFSSRSLFSAGFDSEISFLFSWQTRFVWSPLLSSPLLSSEEEDDEGSCWTLISTSLSKDEIGQLITLMFRIDVSIQGSKILRCQKVSTVPITTKIQRLRSKRNWFIYGKKISEISLMTLSQ